MFLDLLNKQNTTPLPSVHGIQFDEYHGQNEPSYRNKQTCQTNARANDTNKGWNAKKRKRSIEKGGERERECTARTQRSIGVNENVKRHIIYTYCLTSRTMCEPVQTNTTTTLHRRCEIPFWLHKICTIWWMFTCHGIIAVARSIYIIHINLIFCRIQRHTHKYKQTRSIHSFDRC